MAMDIIECERCDAKIRFGDEVKEAQLKGIVKGGGYAGAVALGALYASASTGAITYASALEISARFANALNISSAKPPSERTVDEINKKLVNEVNSELKKLERQAYGWDWHIRMNLDGSFDGPYCEQCK